MRALVLGLGQLSRSTLPEIRRAACGRMSARRPTTMEKDADVYEKIERIVELDSRYKVAAYAFVLLALNYTLAKLERRRHVTGKELLQGIREFGIAQYGPMAKTVFNYWGVSATRDFGEIVFSLVEHKLLGKTEEDKIEDFVDIYDFEDEFVRKYRW